MAGTIQRGATKIQEPLVSNRATRQLISCLLRCIESHFKSQKDCRPKFLGRFQDAGSYLQDIPLRASASTAPQYMHQALGPQHLAVMTSWESPVWCTMTTQMKANESENQIRTKFNEVLHIYMNYIKEVACFAWNDNNMLQILHYYFITYIYIYISADIRKLFLHQLTCLQLSSCFTASVFIVALSRSVSNPAPLGNPAHRLHCDIHHRH